MSEVKRLMGRIRRAKRIAKEEGRLDDPDFQDWLEHAYEEVATESSRSYRWYPTGIELGKGQFGC
jgi:hypothetical protein